MTSGHRDALFQPDLWVQGLSGDATRPLIFPPDGSILSVGAFAGMVSRFAQALAALHPAPGARIGMLSSNRAEVLAVTGASLLNQHALVPMHPMGSLDDHAYIVENSKLDWLVFDPDRFSERAKALRGFGRVAAGACGLLGFGANGVGEDLCARADAFTARPLVAPRVREDDVYRLSYTGGTTGRPKAVVATHRTGLAMTQIQMTEWEWPAEMRQLICAPLSHAGAAMFLPTLLRGGSVSILPNFDPVKVMETIETQRITCVLLVPTMIYALMDHPRFGDFDLSSLETVFYGASAISPPRLKEAIEKLGPVFFQFYGQVEAPMTISVLRRAEHEASKPLRLASCGRPVPWVRVKLMGDDMQEAPDGEPGEICVSGPLVMDGYLDQPEETARALQGGWLHTGDVAVRDRDGFLRIVDRKKDMIVTGGFNVYPREIEDVLATHHAVAACAVVGLPDAHWGEAVVAAVVLRKDSEARADELIALVKEKKGAVHAPKSIRFLTALPLTSVGKPDKRALRSQMLAELEAASGDG